MNPAKGVVLTLVFSLALTVSHSQHSLSIEGKINLSNRLFSVTRWGDYDKDGDSDFIGAGSIVQNGVATPSTVLMKNDGAGNFVVVPVALPGGVQQLEWFDIDNDNDLDIVLLGCINCVSPQTYIFRNDGADKFKSVQHNLPAATGANVVDFNNDGRLDLTLYLSAVPARLYQNNGNYNFSPVMDFTIQNEPLVWADFDSDGWQDFAAGKLLYRNNRNNQFTTINLGFTNTSVSRYLWADLDSDGDEDFMRYAAYTQSTQDKIEIYENQGNQVFVYRGVVNGMKTIQRYCKGDFDANGYTDIIIIGTPAQSGTSATQIAWNTGNWIFQTTNLNNQLLSYYTLQTMDYDGDKDLDFMVYGPGASSAFLLRNNRLPTPQSPTQPTGLQSSLAGNVLTLSWSGGTDNESTLLRYNVYLKRDTVFYITPQAGVNSDKPGIPGQANADHGTSISINAQNLPDGFYSWSVQSVDRECNTSAFATLKEFTINRSNESSAPTELQITATTHNSVTLKWKDNAIDETSYVVERSSVNGNGPFTTIATVAVNTIDYIDNSVSENQTYYYRIKLVQSEISAFSNVVSTTITPFIPNPPSNLELTAVSSTSINLSWVYNPTDHTAFVIQRSDGNGDNFQTIANVGKTVKTYADTGLESQLNYFYRVFAYSPQGNSGFSNIANIATPVHLFSIVTIPTLDYAYGGGESSRSISWGDYDNDGFEDVFMTSRKELYRNKGNGTFEKVQHNITFTNSYNEASSAWGDYDRDGYLDIVIRNSNNQMKLFRNKGNGTFEEVICAITLEKSSSAITWGDLDSDGDLDLLLAGSGRYYYRYDGDELFTKFELPTATSSSQNTAVGDYDDDGYVDLFIGNSGGDQLLKNAKDGSFTPIVGLAPVSDADYSCCPINTPFAIWADYNNDLKLDLTIYHSEHNAYVYKNNKASFEKLYTFSTAMKYYPNIYWEDYDNDGDQDLVFLGTFQDKNKIYENNGKGTLTENNNTVFNEIAPYYSGSWFDYDNDGYKDFISFGVGGRKVYKNAGSGNKWLKIKLTGTASNSKGVGAKIFLKANGYWQRKDVITNHSFQVQQGFVTHFGLRTASKVDSIRVEWPAGSIQTLTAIDPGKIIVIDESDAQIKPLYKPSNLRGKPVPKNTIELVWKDNSQDESGFIVQQSTNGVDFSDLPGLPADTEESSVSNLIMGQVYYFRVVAVKGNTRSLTTNVYKARITLFQNKEIGALTSATDIESSGVSWYDYTKDGLADLFVNLRSGEDALYKNTGNGLFGKDVSLPSDIFNNTRSGAWGDYDNDGNIDLFLAVGGNFITVDDGMVDKLYRNTGSSFVRTTTNPVTSNVIGSHVGAWGDLDNDSYLDLVVTTDRTLIKYGNNAGTSFTGSNIGGQYNSTTLVTLSDLDLDSDLDIIATSDYADLMIYFNDNGLFTHKLDLPRKQTLGFCLEDFDEDGDFDIIQAGTGGLSFLQYNQASNTYEPRGLEGPSGGYNSCTAGDFDNDGHIDFLTSKGSGGLNEIFLNDGEGVFSKHVGEDIDAIVGAHSGATSDYNRDGFLDLLITTNKRRYFFEGMKSNAHWLRTQLRGVQSNRDGVGAKIKLFTATGVQLREIRTNTGSYSGSEQIAHFGLGEQTVVDYLKIEWPSGIKQWIEAPPIDTLLVIEEKENIITVVPTEPAGLTATVVDGADETTIDLTWDDRSNNETAFIVERSVDGGPFSIYDVLPPNTTTYSDDDLPNTDEPATIRYRIVAIFDDAGSTRSNTAELTFAPTAVETVIEKDLKIFPNPANDKFYIECPVPMYEVDIVNAQGQLWYDIHAGGLQFQEVDVEALPDGVYFIRIKTEATVIVRKIVVCKN